MGNFYNFLSAVFFIVLGLYFIYITYKKPDSFLNSTDLKGYLAGIGFLFVGSMGIIGKFNLLEILKKIFNN